MGGNPRKQLRTEEHTVSVEAPVEPQLEAHRAEVLHGEDEFFLAGWLLDPQQNIPAALSPGEKHFSFSPGKGTSTFISLLPQTSGVLGSGQSLAEK